VHESAPLALRNFLPQIRQPNIRAIAFGKILLSILASTSAGIFTKLKRAGHVMEHFGTDIGCMALTIIRESMSVPLGTKVITALVGLLIVLTQTPAGAQYSDGDSGLGGTNCGSLTLQQCRATKILRAQSMLQSGRVYGAQPQLTVPSLSGVFATGNLAYASSPAAGGSSRHMKHKQR
jgi:hypothetical protein